MNFYNNKKYDKQCYPRRCLYHRIIKITYTSDT